MATRTALGKPGSRARRRDIVSPWRLRPQKADRIAAISSIKAKVSCQFPEFPSVSEEPIPGAIASRPSGQTTPNRRMTIREPKRRTDMRVMLLAAAAALTLGSASAAFADGGDLTPNTQFTLQQQQPIQSQAAAIARQAAGSTAVYASQSHNQGTWLFEPDALGGGGR
jgi:hypothetical protein